MTAALTPEQRIEALEAELAAAKKDAERSESEPLHVASIYHLAQTSGISTQRWHNKGDAAVFSTGLNGVAKDDFINVMRRAYELGRADAAPVAAVRKAMARLADLLDEDKFMEIEGIFTSAGFTPPVAAQDNKPLSDEPNMFWNHDDPESPYGSIDEFLNDEWCQGGIEVGDIRRAQRAIRLPDVMVRVTAVSDDGDIDYIVEPVGGIKERG